MVYAGEYGERLVPMACYKDRVGCSALGLRVEVDVATRSTLKEVVQERVKLQSRSNCDACEWEGRYPSGSTIPLDDQRGGCSAAGCVQLGKQEAAAVIQNEDTAEEQTIARLEHGVQTLSGTVDQLRRAALAEMAEKEEAAAARDEARVHLSTCSARANDLDAASAEFERFMAATLVGRDQHTISANETFVPTPSGPDDEPPVEEVFARASARFTEVKNMAVSFIADVKGNLAKSLAEIDSLQQQVGDLEDSSTKSVERAKLAEEETQKLAADLERSMMEIQSLQHKVLDLEDSSTKSEEKAELAEEHGQRTAADLEQSMTEVDSLQQQVFHLEDSSTKSVERAKLAEEETQKLAAELERSMMEIQSLQHKVLDLEDSSTKSEEEARLPQEDRQRVAADLERSLSEIDSLQHKVLDLVKSSTDSEERVKIAEEKRQKLEEKLASYDEKVPIMLIALLAVLVYKLGRPEEPNRRHRFRDRPPIRLPRTPSPERARRSPAAAAVEYAPAVDAGGSEQEAEERAAQRAATLDEARPLQERRAISAPNLAFDAEAAPWALADDAAST
ncbi:unnamed protein product, partial [Scytosiphon promiscuus]